MVTRLDLWSPIRSDLDSIDPNPAVMRRLLKSLLRLDEHNRALK